MTELKIETTELKDIAINCNVDVKQAEEITLGLNPFIEERALLIEEFEEVSKLEITRENIPEFKSLRLKFQKNRTQGINNWHKTAKEIPLRMGQLIDAVKRNQIQINETHEQFLEQAEKHFEIEEQKRLDALQLERVELLSKYVEDAHERNLSSMEDDVWSAYLAAKKNEYEDRIAAEKKAEEERIEQERLRKLKIERENELKLYWKFVPENHPDFESLDISEWSDFLQEMKNAKESYDIEQEEIKKEKERLEKQAQELKARNFKRNDELRPYITFIRDYDALLNSEEKEYKKQFAEIEKAALLQFEHDRKEEKKKRLQEEKDRKEKKELKIKLEAKEKAEREENQRLLDEEQKRIKAEKAAQLAPDKDKLIAWSNSIINSQYPLPKLKTEESSVIMNEVIVLLGKIDKHVKSKVENL